MKQAASKALPDGYFILISCLACSSTLKKEAIFSSETSIDFQQTTENFVPYDKILSHLSSAGNVPLLH
jgi:hypothetical protein